MEPNQVVRDVKESGILGVLSAKDRIILLVLAKLAGSSGIREFSEAPISIARRAGGFRSGTITRNTVNSSLLRMAERGILVELAAERNLVTGRIADYYRLVEIALD